MRNVIGSCAAYCAEAFDSLRRNRLRSALTLVGMVIGVASIIAVLGLSAAASGGIAATIASLGDPGFTVTADPNQDDPKHAAIQYGDIRMLSDTVWDVANHIEPAYGRQMTVRSGKRSAYVFVVSGSDYHTDTLSMRLGRRIETPDVANAKHVCTLSAGLTARLFLDADGLGKTVSLGITRCTVIGVYDELRGSAFAAIGGNDFVELPYTTYHRSFAGPVDQLEAHPVPGHSTEEAGARIVAQLKLLHGGRSQYIVQDQAAALAVFDTVIALVAAGLTGVGGLSLLVAGVGILNIMLISVNERTREIGVRKAIGARPREIALQFLLEAAVLCVVGGIAGAAIGVMITAAGSSSVAAVVGPSHIPYLVIVSGTILFSMLIGVGFGAYPALRAARLDPVVSLRAP